MRRKKARIVEEYSSTCVRIVEENVRNCGRKRVRIAEENPYRLPLHPLPFGAGQTSIRSPDHVSPPPPPPEQNSRALEQTGGRGATQCTPVAGWRGKQDATLPSDAIGQLSSNANASTERDRSSLAYPLRHLCGRGMGRGERDTIVVSPGVILCITGLPKARNNTTRS